MSLSSECGQPDSSVHGTLEIVILYDGDAALRGAMQTAARMTESERGKRREKLRTWSFAELQDSREKACAGGWLAFADMVFVAALENASVPGNVGQLIAHCAGSETGSPVPLVAVGLANAEAPAVASSAFFDSLEAVALSSGMRFFHCSVVALEGRGSTGRVLAGA